MKKKKAFTLIELIIVIAILALLIAIAIPKYQKSNLSAQATAHNANVRVLKNAAILYSIDHPDDKDIKQDEIKPYLESGEFPKPAKALPDKNFTVTVKDGQVVVTPGPVKVKGTELVPDNSNQ